MESTISYGDPHASAGIQIVTYDMENKSTPRCKKYAKNRVLSHQALPDNDRMTTTTPTTMIPELRKALKRLHYPLEVMLVCARCYGPTL